ncbi:alpha/beta hydrolase [Gordonia sp. NPDC003504]
MTSTNGRSHTAVSALVVMPGTGSDADFARRAFGAAAARMGVELIALQPEEDLLGGHRRRLDESAERYGRILVGGISIGAAIALDWALGRGGSDRAPDGSDRCAGVWAALPAWSGVGDWTLAAQSAAATARALRIDGLEATIAAMRHGSPTWLGAELTRSWRALYPGLVGQLEQAARYRAPTVDDIAHLAVPLAITAAADDPLHPLEVAEHWCAAAPKAHLVRVGLHEWGQNPSVLGRSCARAWGELVR